MKEMLFIMVAVLVPPTLTYLGIVGNSHAQRTELTWNVPTQSIADAQVPVSAQQKRAVVQECWSDSSF